MKVTPTLIKIIKHVVANHNDTIRKATEEKTRHNIDEYRRKTSKAADKLRRRLHRLETEAMETKAKLKELGYECSWNGQRLSWQLHSKLTNSLRAAPTGPYLIDVAIIAQLATADEKQAIAILKQIGIVWR